MFKSQSKHPSIGWALLLSLFMWLYVAYPVYAWDLWLVTNQHRILVIRDVDTAPTQVYLRNHDPIPGAYEQALGDLAFAPNGTVYGISVTLGVPSALYVVDVDTGAVTYVGDFPFQWGTSLHFHPRTEQGYAGGGLESWSPYEMLRGFYVFDNYDPATTRLWHDMRTEGYPDGGYIMGYTHHQGYLYTFWGQGHRYAHTTYLLRITEDADGNFVSFVNLGDAEGHGIPQGPEDLISDGVNLYVLSEYALYRATNYEGDGPATYTKILDFDLNPGELVYSATAPWADLELSLETAPATSAPAGAVNLIVRLANRGPYASERIQVAIPLPAEVRVYRQSSTQGAYDVDTATWSVGDLAVNGEAVLTLTLLPGAGTGSFEVRAWVTHSSALDPDSSPLSDMATDDLGDELADDDEAILQIVVPSLPETGFAPGRITPLAPRPAEAQFLVWRVRIPRLGVDAPIVGVPFSARGWDVSWLNDQVGWLHGSAFPTWEGNTVLTAHVWNADNTPGLFYNLKHLRYGDRVYLYTDRMTATYMVVDNRLVPPAEVKMAFAPADADVLTLLTCQGFDAERETYVYRRLVRAVRVEGDR